MKSNYRTMMVLLAGVAIGAIALEGLHAQGAKPKAYLSARPKSSIPQPKPHTSLSLGRR